MTSIVVPVAIAAGHSRRRQARATAVLVAIAVLVSTFLAVQAQPAHASTEQIFMIGDSLTYGSLPYQSDEFVAAGWSSAVVNGYPSRSVRAKVSRDLYTGLTAVDGLRAKYGDTPAWVVALGTNDSIIFSSTQYVDIIRQMMDRIGSGHHVLWVNVYLPTYPTQMNRWNAALQQVAAERPGEMFIDDWATYASTHGPWLASDHVHYTATGYLMRSKEVARASQQLRITWAHQVATERRQVTPDGPTGGLVAATPARALDTRASRLRFAQGEVRQIDLSAYQASDAAAVAVNLTVANTAGAGFLTAWPCDRDRPDTSNVNYAANDTASSAAIVRTANGMLCVYSQAATDVIVDVTGSFAPGGVGYSSQQPLRLLDTRTNGGPVGAGKVRSVQLPVGATAAMLNLTAADPSASGYLTAWPCDQPQPLTSSVNFKSGPGARANAAVVSAAADGTVCVFTDATTQVIVDLFGTFSASGSQQFQPVVPVRLLDTRTGIGGWLGMLNESQVVTIDVMGGAGRVAVGSLTVVSPLTDGFMTVWDGAGSAPNSSNVNFRSGQTTPNLATSQVSSDDTFRAGVGGKGMLFLLFDLTGIFVG